MQNGGGATQRQRFIGLGSGIDCDGMAGCKQLAHFLTQLFTQLVIKVDQRLVEQDQLGVLDQRPGHSGALLLPTGQLEGVALQEFFDAQHLRRFLHTAVDNILGQTGLTQRRGNVFKHRHAWVIDELLINHRDVAQTNRSICNIDPVHQHPPAVRLVQPGHQAHQAGFAGQGSPQQNVERSWLKAQGSVVDPDLTIDRATDVLQRERHGVPFVVFFLRVNA